MEQTYRVAGIQRENQQPTAVTVRAPSPEAAEAHAVSLGIQPSSVLPETLAPLPDEKVYLSNNLVLVTDQRVVLPTGTIMLAEVEATEFVTQHPSGEAWSIVLMVAGGICAGWGWAEGTHWMVWGGGSFALLGFLFYVSAVPLYVLRIEKVQGNGNSNSKSEVLTSLNRSFATQLAEAMERALRDRGG